MRTLLVVAGLATGVALLSGVILLAAGPSGPAGGGEAAGDPPRRATTTRAAAPADPAPADLERRLRDLEAGLDEVRARLDLLAGTGTFGAGPGGVSMAGALSGAAGDAGLPGEDPGETGDPDATAEDGAEEPTVEERLAAMASQASGMRDRLRELRREAEIREKVDLAAGAMALQPFEKTRLEEIVRNHVQRVDELSARAREMLEDSPFGLTPSDRSVVEQMEGDRKRIDQETEQALLTLVGKERWRDYRKAEKDQRNKERALRRLGQPW